MVECNLPKVDVAGSIPVSCFFNSKPRLHPNMNPPEGAVIINISAPL